MATIGMGFSVAHDPDVQAYKELRTKYLAQKREQKSAMKVGAKAARSEALQGADERKRHDQGRSFADKIFRRRKAVSVRGDFVDAKKLEDDSYIEDEFEKIDMKVAQKH